MRACRAALVAIGVCTLVVALLIVASFGSKDRDCNQAGVKRAADFLSRRARGLEALGGDKELIEARALATAASDYLVDDGIKPNELQTMESPMSFLARTAQRVRGVMK